MSGLSSESSLNSTLLVPLSLGLLAACFSGLPLAPLGLVTACFPGLPLAPFPFFASVLEVGLILRSFPDPLTSDFPEVDLLFRTLSFFFFTGRVTLGRKATTFPPFSVPPDIGFPPDGFPLESVSDSWSLEAALYLMSPWGFPHSLVVFVTQGFLLIFGLSIVLEVLPGLPGPPSWPPLMLPDITALRAAFTSSASLTSP